MDRQIAPLTIIQDQIGNLLRGLIALTPNLIAAAFVLVATWIAVFLLGKAGRKLTRKWRARPSLRRALSSLARIGAWVLGILVAATIAFPGLTPTSLLAGLGIGSIAVGLAFKDIFENYIAGLLILLRAPMRIGDDIVCDDISGRVEEITIRDTYVRKRSGELILVPNSYIYKNPTTVLTDRPRRRITLVVGVAYGEDVDRSRTVIAEAVENATETRTDEKVEVFAQAFSSSSIDFLVRWWAGSTPADEHASRDKAVAAIKSALDTAGIEIPFPYRTLTFKQPLKVLGPEDEAEPETAT
ncbi:mechanosensitive ion channel family protein [Bauldia litoralis]|uniref:Small-conductance mechanosensitive channel n=1 Tax=Bauldia litoralis TaxID=665467 RepID=A0A1G6DS48_9HYPH|nr:mechanosensitive ion channel family protein [Bauldia litoralis]SDB47920.1 Small-conductance mechanosensitive channel [Bauldia litoralis]